MQAIAGIYPLFHREEEFRRVGNHKVSAIHPTENKR
jgi:hypothetical protein